MSIIAATAAFIGQAASGAAMGTMISGIVIKFQKSVYDKKIAELQKYANELDSHLVTLGSYKSEIPNFWNDETGKKYEALLQTQINQIKSTKQSIDSLSTLYEDLKAALDSAQSKVNTKVEEITGVIGALTGLTE